MHFPKYPKSNEVIKSYTGKREKKTRQKKLKRNDPLNRERRKAKKNLNRLQQLPNGT